MADLRSLLMARQFGGGAQGLPNPMGGGAGSITGGPPPVPRQGNPYFEGQAGPPAGGARPPRPSGGSILGAQTGNFGQDQARMMQGQISSNPYKTEDQ